MARREQPLAADKVTDFWLINKRKPEIFSHSLRPPAQQGGRKFFGEGTFSVLSGTLFVFRAARVGLPSHERMPLQAAS